MCGICGCTTEENSPMSHEHDDSSHAHAHHSPTLISIEQDLLTKNNQYALANRQAFLKQKVTTINLMSSPGAGKTTLLAKTISALKHDLDIAVVVGDQQTDYDAEKIKASGATAIQVNTGKVCHLDAHMVGHAVENLSLKEQGILFIENVGNLVCPALFDLGEAYKIVILSVTEGDNKPLKYPEMFRKANLLLLTKMDLLPYVDFDINACIDYAKRINPAVTILSLSATTGTGLSDWYAWLKQSQSR